MRSARSPHPRSGRPGSFALDAAGTAARVGPVSACPVSAATSRAMPRMLMQSPRFGVRLTSRIVSSRPSASISLAPVVVSAGNSSSPTASSDSASSRAEQSMPNDSTPRSLACLISMPPGSFAPTVASGAFMPARALGAPQTICTVSDPVFTWHTLSVSALGCFTRSTISPTITPGSGGAAASTPSISRPAIVSRAASSFGAGSGPPIHSLNHRRLMRIVGYRVNRTAAGSAGRSRSRGGCR